jgi:hypothetical protein
MPSTAHQAASRFFDVSVEFAAMQLTGAALGQGGFSNDGAANEFFRPFPSSD